MPYEYSTKYGSRFPRKVQGSFAGGLCPDWVRVGRETDIEKGETMPKIVLHGKYSQEAWEGLDATGTSARKEAVGALLASTGASLEAMYMMPGSNWDFMMRHWIFSAFLKPALSEQLVNWYSWKKPRHC